MSIQDPILLLQIGYLLTNAQGGVLPLKHSNAKRCVRPLFQRHKLKLVAWNPIRKSLSSTSLLKQAIELMSGDRQESTISNCESSWRKFYSWPGKIIIDPFRYDVKFGFYCSKIYFECKLIMSQRDMNKMQDASSFTHFSENSKLCLVKTLNDYLKVTKQRRIN